MVLFSKKVKATKSKDKKGIGAKKAVLTAVVVASVGSGFNFGARSNTNLATVCPATQQLAHCAISETQIDFMVIEGFRPQSRQNALYAQGRTTAGWKVTWTLNSRHTSGRAIDIVALRNGEIDWSSAPYAEVNKAFRVCSARLGIEYVWGGTFKGRDWGHFETKQCTVTTTAADI